MWWPPIGRIVTICVCLYAAHALYTIVTLFSAPACPNPKRCFAPALGPRDVALFLVAPQSSPRLVFEMKDFDYRSSFKKEIELDIPRKLRNNNSANLYVGIAKSKMRELTWDDVRQEGVLERIPLMSFVPPQISTFNLLSDKAEESSKDERRPVAHLKSFISFSMLSDPLLLPIDNIPAELRDRIKLTRDDKYLPIVQYNFLKSRLTDLVEVKKNLTSANITLEYVPTSIGKIKFLVHISMAMESLKVVGFTEKDLDDVKGIFADTNLYLLCATILVSSFHLLFDFLAFKNDVSFWRSKSTMEGLSVRTVLWRAFSQSIVFLYLLDENTSMLVLVPSGVAALIEIWKVKKILHLDLDWTNRRFPRIYIKANTISKAEMRTRAVDAEAMKYLSYLLYPICVCGAVYSLIYQPHKSWYSWTLNSMVNGVYAFGFLFMLPQLFINYKLKSVAALPWRAFMYKAFNTFIDDVFAFIITMPVAHRVACFRDDIVFIIYLYQRWLYPVDKTRVDNSYGMEETVDDPHEKKE